MFIDPDENITIKGTVFRGTEGLWELLTRKNVNTQLIGKEGLKTWRRPRNVSGGAARSHQ